MNPITWYAIDFSQSGDVEDVSFESIPGEIS